MEDGRGDRYGYDEEGQLELADYRMLNPETTTPGQPKRRDRFHYDQLGNRMGSANLIASRGPGAISFSRENNGLNQYVSWTPSAINQDDDMGEQWGAPGQANGVTMQEGWITASFNALNQPMGIWSPVYGEGETAQYMWFGYDPLGRCVKRWMGNDQRIPVSPNATTYYYYDGWNLVQEGPGGSAVDRTYVHGGRVDEIVASQAGGVWVYHHYDARGHCILLTNASNGAIREQYDYDAFGFPYFYNASGVKLVSSGQFGNRFLFTGREWLKDLRVYDYRNRIYQPELGRFLQPDPKGFEAGDYNLYRYCHNDPVNRSDPDGTYGWLVNILRGLLAGAAVEKGLDETRKHVPDEHKGKFDTARKVYDTVPSAKKAAVHGGKLASRAERALVKRIKDARGKGTNVKVKTQQEAEQVIEQARPEIPWRPTYEAPRQSAGKEIHLPDGSGEELPHIKWYDWRPGKSQGADGHIYFEGLYDDE